LILIREIGFGLSPRHFLSRMLWQRVDQNEIILVSSTLESSRFFDKKFFEANGIGNFVETKESSFWHLEGIEDTDTMLLTFVVQLDLGGLIPAQFVETVAISFLNDYSTMRQQFSKDYEINKKSREAILDGFQELKVGEVEHTTRGERRSLACKEYNQSIHKF